MYVCMYIYIYIYIYIYTQWHPSARQGPYTDQLHVALEHHLLLQEAYCRGGWLKLHMAFQQLTGAELTKVPSPELGRAYVYIYIYIYINDIGQ